MKITTLQEVIDGCVGELEWGNVFKLKRQTMLNKFRFSVLVEGSGNEISTAIDWCLNKISERNDFFNENKEYESNFRRLNKSSPTGLWSEIWYDKIDYDYGISEFFFQNENDLKNFTAKISDFYGITEDGRKFRTDGADNYIELKS